MNYPNSLTDTQWQLIETILEDEMLQRKRVWPLRSIFDAIFYVIKGGIKWRMIPSDFSPWQQTTTITVNGERMVAGAIDLEINIF
ncbi:transposase [Botryobacter ruber]|uniref:transposase n=1 Tax=Botryobacter ruber TaxID=2171629 RepID=UPI000E0CB285|nr:transposase [Botryobacter ruber]